MSIKMNSGYSNSIRNKYYSTVEVPASSTSDVVVIPACTRIDLEADTNTTIQVTMFPVPKSQSVEDFDFTGATWHDWDGVNFISPNITGVRGVNAGGSTESFLVRCS